MDNRDILNLYEAYVDIYSELDEAKKEGLWANIHAKRARGERPAKPGEKGYPKTLDIEEGIEQARKNVGASKCWKGKKLGNPPTKMEGGKEVPNCEEVDLNDLILLHLIDEGYAETPEAAEKIMVNMSEDWMNNILDEAKIDWHNRDQSNVSDRVNVLRDRNRRNTSGVPDGYQTAVRRTRHDVSRGKKKQKGLKTTSDNLGKMGRGPYRKQQYKRTGNDLYKD